MTDRVGASLAKGRRRSRTGSGSFRENGEAVMHLPRTSLSGLYECWYCDGSCAGADGSRKMTRLKDEWDVKAEDEG